MKYSGTYVQHDTPGLLSGRELNEAFPNNPAISPHINSILKVRYFYLLNVSTTFLACHLTSCQIVQCICHQLLLPRFIVSMSSR